MSRSNVTEGSRNPSTRWFEWNGSGEGGTVRWYDKEAQKNVEARMPFTFLLLDELATIKGWHESSESAIFANEVKDTRQDALVVRAFKGGELASGFYQDIRDRIKALGGHFHASCYIAYKDGDELKLGNLGFKGAAVRAWMEFKKNAPTRKNAEGKSVKAFYVDAVVIDGYEEGKKGSIKFRVPTFKLKPVAEDTQHQAIALDQELQSFLTDYLRRPRTEQATVSKEALAADEPLPEQPPRRDFEDDDIPF
jgi:hypothetical protein